MRFSLTLFTVLFVAQLQAQFHRIPVLPSLSGQALLDQLVIDYKPLNVQSYSFARDVLYGSILADDNGTVRCVYTGLEITIPFGADPTDWNFMNGSNNGMNTEHTWPQSNGASIGNARADMHHLFPTRSPVNSARGSLPFGEVNDNSATSWYYLTTTQGNVPGSNIDLYSELGNGFFEPREDHKGNVARAMFYFYTMYRAQADAADPNYFGLQQSTDRKSVV